MSSTKPCISGAEYDELVALRAYKASKEASRSDRAFEQLELLLQNVNYDPLCSPRAFRLLAECILALREELQR